MCFCNVLLSKIARTLRNANTYKNSRKTCEITVTLINGYSLKGSVFYVFFLALSWQIRLYQFRYYVLQSIKKHLFGIYSAFWTTSSIKIIRAPSQFWVDCNVKENIADVYTMKVCITQQTPASQHSMHSLKLSVKDTQPLFHIVIGTYSRAQHVRVLFKWLREYKCAWG